MKPVRSDVCAIWRCRDPDQRFMWNDINTLYVHEYSIPQYAVSKYAFEINFLRYGYINKIPVMLI